MTLTIYHAVIEVSSTIPATAKTVMKAELPNERMKSDCVKPLTKLSKPAKVSPLGRVNGASEI